MDRTGHERRTESALAIHHFLVREISGTTSDKSKFILQGSSGQLPLPGGRDLLATYLNLHPESKLFSGKGLIMGGSHQVNQLNEHSKYGDVSAVMMQNMPIFGQLVKTRNSLSP